MAPAKKVVMPNNYQFISPDSRIIRDKNPTFCIVTLGCKVNKADTDLMQQSLLSSGYNEVSFDQGADVYIINTCTVTAKSDFHSRQFVRRALRQNDQAKVIVTGCYAQTNPKALEQMPGVSLVLGNKDKDKVEKYLRPMLNWPPPDFKDALHSETTGEKQYISKPDHHYTRTFLKIQDGCDWACSYCIVPLARGKSCSRPLHEAIQQAKQSITQGYKEIVLTGIHIGRYGIDLSPKISLAHLLTELCSLDGLQKIRLSSIEPTEFSPELINVLQNSSKICPHFHIPLQSADNNLLRTMGRNYNFEQYQKLIYRLRDLLPDAALGCDVIVGFPGENEAGFQTTYQAIEQLPLTYLHVFSYSKRQGTKAATFPNQVTPNDKKIRSSKLRALGKQKKVGFYQSQIQQIRPSLILNQRHPENNHLIGLSDNYINIQIDGEDNLINRLLPLRITNIIGDQVFGQISVV